MTCKGLTDFIADYVEGDLPPLLRTTFEEHLAACPEYVAYLTSYRETIALGRAAATSSDGSVPEELMRAIVQLRAAARVVHRKSVAGVDDPWSRLGTGTRTAADVPATLDHSGKSKTDRLYDAGKPPVSVAARYASAMDAHCAWHRAQAADRRTAASRRGRRVGGQIAARPGRAGAVSSIP
jgi:anti-sigma factor RsiW